MGEEEELSKRKKLPIIAPMMLGSTLPIPQYYFSDNNNYDDAVHKTFSSLLTVAHAGRRNLYTRKLPMTFTSLTHASTCYLASGSELT